MTFCEFPALAQDVNGSRAKPVAVQSSSQELKWAFEDGLNGWTRRGSAFDSQPVAGEAIKTDNIPKLVRVGGDYWRDLPYQLGHEGKYLIRTEDGPTGTLTSKEFVLTSQNKYFSFLIGGTSDVAHERLELQVLTRDAADAVELQRLLKSWRTNDVVEPLTRDGDYLTAVIATGQYGPNQSVLELLRQESVEVPAFLFDRTARLQIVDESSTAHINVDYIRFSVGPPEPYRPSVWGYGDYHTHPNSHLAFGALRQKNLLWGSPGGAFASYSDQNLISKDIPQCTGGHGGGPLAEIFINQVEWRARLDQALWRVGWDWIRGRLTRHDRSGGPKFHGFPSFLSGAHQQMHITQIHRNYEGGLRLMVAFATHNRGAEYLTSRVEHGGHILPPTEDREVVEAEISEMKYIADLNRDWMEIAYDPDSARRIIRQNKLAVILGIEVDELGQLNKSKPETAAEEIDYLWKLGIRKVVPVHGSDNKLGGAAVWRNEYNWLSDFLNRGKYDVSVAELKSVPARFFQVRDGACKHLPEEQGECVKFRLPSEQRRVVIKWMFGLGRTPYPEPFNYAPYKEYEAHKNVIGLKPDGSTYIAELMRRGMIIDTAHMSDASVKDVYALIGADLERRHPECKGFSFDADLSKISQFCFDEAYPAIVSHAHFRAQSFYEKRTLVEESLPSEYQIGRRNLELMRRIGGTVGPFVTERTLALPKDQLEPPFKNDCTMSSKGFGLSFLFALQKMEGQGVGMATDFTIIPTVAPRFGNNACWGYHRATDPKKERHKNPDFYDKNAQRDGVVYKGIERDPRVSYGYNEPLIPYRMGERKPFDFNLDGLAHFGMVPDMLQDLKNLGMTRRDFEALFSSAEGYLRMWEKVWRVSGCAAGKAVCMR